MALKIHYIFLTVILAMTVLVDAFDERGTTRFREGDRLCSKFSVIRPNKKPGSHVQHGNNPKGPTTKHSIARRNLGARFPLPTKAGRIRRAALWDLLDFAAKPMQTGPIYVPSVLLPKHPKKSTACRIWKKLFSSGN